MPRLNRSAFESLRFELRFLPSFSTDLEAILVEIWQSPCDFKSRDFKLLQLRFCNFQELSGTPNHWYFLRSIAGTNGRRTAVQIEGVLPYKLDVYRSASLSPKLRSQQDTALQMVGVLRYNIEVYCQYFIDKLYGLGAPKQCPILASTKRRMRPLLVDTKVAVRVCAFTPKQTTISYSNIPKGPFHTK